jgi:hypothetical protein
VLGAVDGDEVFLLESDGENGLRVG